VSHLWAQLARNEAWHGRSYTKLARLQQHSSHVETLMQVDRNTARRFIAGHAAAAQHMRHRQLR
jgi:hypothetical protein